MQSYHETSSESWDRVRSEGTKCRSGKAGYGMETSVLVSSRSFLRTIFQLEHLSLNFSAIWEGGFLRGQKHLSNNAVFDGQEINNFSGIKQT